VLTTDAKWEKRVPWSQFAVVVFGLAMYCLHEFRFWITPYRIAKYGLQVSSARMAAMVFLNIMGVVCVGLKQFLHFTSDVPGS
jgi:hypothetical protein